MNKIKVGIIGCGQIAQKRHIPEYLTNEKVSLVACYDIDKTRSSAVAKEFGGRAYSSVDELFASGIDAVSICSLNHTHADLSIKAMRQGLDVLCEKPMATTLDDARAMDAVAKETGKILMIGQNQRLNATHIKAKELITEGAIGRVISFSLVFGHGGPETWSIDPGVGTWFFDKKKAVIGAMADLGIHKTDLLIYLLDDPIHAVTARLATLDKKDDTGDYIGVEDNAFCIYEMQSGAIGTMRASWTFYTGEDNSTIIYGSKGVLRLYSDSAHSLILERRGGQTEYFAIDAMQTNEHQSRSGIIDEFISAIQTRHTSISSSSVLVGMKAVFGAIRSSEEGRRIVLEEV